MSFQGTTLIEPDRRISRIRLSEKTHTELGRYVTPSATSEHFLGLIDSTSIPPSSSLLAFPSN